MFANCDRRLAAPREQGSYASEFHITVETAYPRA